MPARARLHWALENARRSRIMPTASTRSQGTMPIYEYRCGACSHELEALQKVSDSSLRKCPECGKLTLRRLISAPVFRLKGGGWYETDFKSAEEQKRNLVGEEKEAASSEAKTDAKPAEKAAESKPTEPTPEKSEKKATTVAVKKPAKAAPRKKSKPAAKKK